MLSEWITEANVASPAPMVSMTGRSIGLIGTCTDAPSLVITDAPSCPNVASMVSTPVANSRR